MGTTVAGEGGSKREPRLAAAIAAATASISAAPTGKSLGVNSHYGGTDKGSGGVGNGKTLAELEAAHARSKVEADAWRKELML